MMAFHLTPPAIDERVHLMLALAAFWCCLAVAIEGAYLRNQPIASINKTVAILTHGSFLYNAAFMIYKQERVWGGETGVMMVPAVFCLHVVAWFLAAFVFLLGAGLTRDPLSRRTRDEDAAVYDEL